MSRKPRRRVVYHLESQCSEGAMWLPVLDEHRQPLTWTGRGAKSRALTMGAIVIRWPSPAWWAVRVRSDAETVKTWVRKDGKTS